MSGDSLMMPGATCKAPVISFLCLVMVLMMPGASCIASSDKLLMSGDGLMMPSATCIAPVISF